MFSISNRAAITGALLACLTALSASADLLWDNNARDH